MLLNKMKSGSLGEKYRVQLSSLTNLILYSLLFISIGFLGLFFYPAILAIWILCVILVDIAIVMFAKTLLLYDEGFIVTSLSRFKNGLKKSPYTKFINVHVYVRVVRGNNYFNFFYENEIGKKDEISYKIANVSKVQQSLYFLHSKNIPIYINDEYYASNVFKTKVESLKVLVIDKKIWYTMGNIPIII